MKFTGFYFEYNDEYDYECPNCFYKFENFNLKISQAIIVVFLFVKKNTVFKTQLLRNREQAQHDLSGFIDVYQCIWTVVPNGDIFC